MSRRPLIWHLFPTYLLVTVLSIVAVAGYTSRSLRNFYSDQVTQNLQAKNGLLMPQLAPLFAENPGAMMEHCKSLGRAGHVRITAILPDGTVIGDSDEDPAQMENHAGRPEIVGALTGNQGASVRFSNTLNTNMLFVAMPVKKDDAIIGVLRTASPMTALDKTLHALFRQIVMAGLTIALLAALVSWGVARRIVSPLEAIRVGADRFAQGDLKGRLPVPDSMELAHVADTLNKMASQLDERIRTIVRQRNEQEAVFTSMVEGVVAVNKDECIIAMNRAAAKLFGVVSSEEVQGRRLQTVVRNSALQEFLAEAMHSQEPIEREIVLRGAGEQILQVHGTVLRDASGQPLGSVIVLNDVTHLRRLEQVRRDFVANVSHELKTPITSIKGFVETLQDGACQNPEDLERFLGIIAKQANRMNAIIEDLLILSRIEQEKGDTGGLLQKESVMPVVESAVQLCMHTATAKDVRVDVQGDPAIEACINPALLEQGVMNLVDNAIKYSDQGAEVTVYTERAGDEVLIHVKDTGRGISSEHLPRLFERFYRVDKARSREVGGTGLGLAIVKHIAKAHGGRVDVVSKLDSGSTFTIYLPVEGRA